MKEINPKKLNDCSNSVFYPFVSLIRPGFVADDNDKKLWVKYQAMYDLCPAELREILDRTASDIYQYIAEREPGFLDQSYEIILRDARLRRYGLFLRNPDDPGRSAAFCIDATGRRIQQTIHIVRFLEALSSVGGSDYPADVLQQVYEDAKDAVVEGVHKLEANKNKALAENLIYEGQDVIFDCICRVCGKHGNIYAKNRQS